MGGQFFQGNFFPVVAMDVLEDLLDQAVVFSGTGLPGRLSGVQDAGKDEDELEKKKVLLDILGKAVGSRLEQPFHQSADLGQFLVGQLDGLGRGPEQGFQIGIGRGKLFQDSQRKPDGIAVGGFIGTAETVMDFKRMDQEETAHLQRIFLFLQEEITNIVQADVNFQLVMGY